MSNTYWFITSLMHPFLLLMVVLGACVFWPRRAPLTKRRWLQAIFILLYIYCTPLAAYTSTGWLERRFPKVIERPQDLDAIVVLTGGAISGGSESVGPQLGESSLKRCLRAARLYHAGAPCPLIVTGGVAYASERHPPMSELMRDVLLELGVAQKDIILEDRSRNTEENAEFTTKIIQENAWKRIALVTSATHLWRSEHLFRRYSVETIPVGCLYRQDEFVWNVFAFLPSETAPDQQQEAFHEYLGAAYLWVRGKW